MNCKFRKTNGPCQRKATKGKAKRTFLLHKTCSTGYTQCKQMQELEKNFREFCKLAKKNREQLAIPNMCTPFIGTRQRHFKEFLEKEEEMQNKRHLQAMKTKELLCWKKPTNLVSHDENTRTLTSLADRRSETDKTPLSYSESEADMAEDDNDDDSSSIQKIFEPGTRQTNSTATQTKTVPTEDFANVLDVEYEMLLQHMASILFTSEHRWPRRGKKGGKCRD